MSDRVPLILVVDDESHILHVVSLKLTHAGYEVITAEDGEEALAMALEHGPDLVITDYQMPFMSGLELCVAMREHEATRDTPALMLTARGFSIGADCLEQTNIVGVEDCVALGGNGTDAGDRLEHGRDAQHARK